jgi:hypothetical protein
MPEALVGSRAVDQAMPRSDWRMVGPSPTATIRLLVVAWVETKGTLLESATVMLVPNDWFVAAEKSQLRGGESGRDHWKEEATVGRMPVRIRPARPAKTA